MADNVFATEALVASDVEEINNRMLAISEAENIVVERPYHEKTALDVFVEDNKLLDAMHVVDVGSIVESGSTKYYTDFATCVSDMNAGISTGSTASSTGAVCQLFTNSDGINCIKLLSDISTSSNITISSICIIDVNGLSMTINASYITNEKPVCVYGIKSNSKIVYIDAKQTPAFYMKADIYMIGISIQASTIRTSDESSTGIAMFFFMDRNTKNVRLYISDVSFDFKTEYYVCMSFLVARSYESNIVLNKIKLNIECRSVVTNVVTGCPIYIPDPNYIFLEIYNSIIVYTQKNNDTDETVCAITVAGNTSTVGSYCYMLIKDSEICGSNTAFIVSQHINVVAFVENTVMSGAYHGGFYGAGSIDSPLCFKNCELKLIYDETFTDRNYYSCYIGYNAKCYFDNCKFTSYNDQYNRPAIKTGSDSTHTYNNTQAYFSNCKMDSIRVDSGCRAYMGLGMPDSLKQQTVDGEIIDTGTDSYSFNLIMDETGASEDEIKESLGVTE